MYSYPAIPIFAFLLQNAILVSSTPAAALLGPDYPPPVDLTSDCSLVSAAWSNSSATISRYIKQNKTLEGVVPDLGSWTFSVGAFSIFDAQAAKKLQYHHTGKDVQSSEIGVTRVNGDSVYRVASVTKVFTVYLALIEIGSRYWNSPITDFIPELAEYSNRTAPDPLNVVDWKSVTLGALAGQIAGIPRDTAIYANDLEISQGTSTLGLPALNISNEAIDPCISFSNASGIFCPREPYFQAWTKRAPVFSPWTTPIYTDGGFALLSLAMENITGRPFYTMLQEDMLKPLGMKSTSLQSGPLQPTDLTHSVIPWNNASKPCISYQSFAANDLASGGVFSTINDLGKFGLSILNSTLLSSLETRKWLKPISHTGSLKQSVDRPWEVLRITHQTNGRVSDLYTKEGDGLGYSSMLILSPDHGAGFSVCITGDKNNALIPVNAVADILTFSVIPALESQAAAEGAKNLAGTYMSESPSLNSSVTLSVDLSRGFDLLVTSWISNGTDMSSWLASSYGDELSLFQTDLRSAPVGQAGQVAFRGTFGDSKFKLDVGTFVDHFTTNVVWTSADAYPYGDVSLDLFIFDVDATGKAVAVSPAWTRAKLQKVT